MLGFTVSLLDDSLELRNHCLGNFEMNEGHTHHHLREIIHKVVRDRMGGRIPTYFLSDSAPVNPKAVRLYLHASGDDAWFPCAVHFAQLAMREAVRIYLSAPTILHAVCNTERETRSDKSLRRNAATSDDVNTFERIAAKCRAIRTTIKRSHACSALVIPSR